MINNKNVYTILFSMFVLIKDIYIYDTVCATYTMMKQ